MTMVDVNSDTYVKIKSMIESKKQPQFATIKQFINLALSKEIKKYE